MESITTKTKVIAQPADVTLDGELSKVGITAMFFAAGLVGAWGVACLFSGLAHSGGPLSFVRNWIGALVGG